ncbi:hypothetical protein ACFLQ6_00135 [Thermoproteota archaeon]
MTTFEEELVDAYYNLKGYFTARNLSYSASKKRRGGKGRGEIDLLAVKVNNRIVEDAIHVEVGVSIKSAFPFINRSKKNVDEPSKLIKKFFISDSPYLVRQYIGKTPYRLQQISSRFDGKSAQKLHERLKELGGKNIRIIQNGDVINLKMRYEGKEKFIEIVTFQKILEDLIEIFTKKDLLKKHFQDNRLRGIQYLVKGINNSRMTAKPSQL